MKRMIGLLMVVGIIVGVVGCGDDANPVKPSNEDLLVGTWIADDPDSHHSWTYHSDGTMTNYDTELGENVVDGRVLYWSINGDNLTWSMGRGDPVIFTFSVTGESLTISTIPDGEEEAHTQTFTRKK